jgi:hypothetical protein
MSQVGHVPLRLTVSREEARRRLAERVTAGRAIRELGLRTRADLDAAETKKQDWLKFNETLVGQLFATSNVKGLFAESGFGGISVPRSLEDLFDYFRHDMDREIARLEGVIDRLSLAHEPDDKPAARTGTDSALDAVNTLERIANTFHSVVKQLQVRRQDRPTLDVKDEYDVQDLIHSLLRLFFDDIRPEEWTPTHAGAASRVDFLLKREKVVVEVKHTRRGLDAKTLGEQLIVDIARYRSHPDCRVLFCLVYDPEGRIHNARGVEHDLESAVTGLLVRVLIRPA